jgi:hypothetical protein
MRRNRMEDANVQHAGGCFVDLPLTSGRGFRARVQAVDCGPARQQTGVKGRTTTTISLERLLGLCSAHIRSTKQLLIRYRGGAIDSSLHSHFGKATQPASWKLGSVGE